MSTNGNNTTAELASLKKELREDISSVGEKVERLAGPSLVSMTPRKAVDKYFEVRGFEGETKNTQKSALYNHFLHWCEEIAEIDDMNDLTGEDLSDYRVWRRDKASDRVEKLDPITEKSQQKIVRTFLKTCEEWEVVRPRFHEFVRIPNVKKSDEVRDQILDSETAKDILSWLDNYEYASREHVVWLLLSECGARVGAIHSLDLGDYSDDDEGVHLEFEHRPEEGTTLKNGEEGERLVDIGQEASSILDDYIANKRVEVTDEYDREPLLTTKHGRLAKTTMRNYIYAWTRPCAIGRECPYDKDPDECEGAQRKQWAFKCPDSLSTHPVRKGYITQELKAGVPKAVISNRCDLSEVIMDKHYDFRSEEEKMKARRVARKMALESELGYGE